VWQENTVFFDVFTAVSYIVSFYGEANQQLFHSNTTVESYYLRNSEDDGDMFSESSVLTRTTRQKATEGFYH
jgi:hypothetical protein